MNKIMVSLMSLCVIASAQGSEGIKEWARTKTSITINTTKNSITVPINGESTIAGVKKYLEQEEGISAGHQRIDLLWRDP